MAAEEDVYCTLVMNDAYLPGAAVLAHSLRDAGANKKLACLIVQDGLRASTIEELQSLYNYVIPTDRIGNPNPANLYLMNRPDLLYTFTKIELWRQVQFRKIVYIDADVVALRAPEELFDISESFAAAPDVGWPDAFNTGVMVISPHIGDYHALRGLANAGDSFDGADQGLLNQYYEHRPWKRLSFTYNTTPSANYQYEPAYRYFKRDITLVHFIGSEKPWQRGRSTPGMPNAFQEMLSRWWAVYDRHFKVSTNEYINGQRNPLASYVQDNQSTTQKPSESYSSTGYPVASTQPAPPPHQIPQHDMHYHQPHHDSHHHRDTSHHAAPALINVAEQSSQPPVVEQRRFSAPHMEWDATRGAPPIESKPEASNFPTQTYEFNTDPKPFRPPPSYPEPPRDMWYTVPEKPKVEEKPKPIFPWEEREASRPTRKFVDDEPLPPPPRVAPEPEPYADELEVTSDSKVEPLTPTIRVHDSDPWTAFNSNRNAWDDVSGIESYVRALTSFQKNRGKVQVIQQNVPSTGDHILSPTNEPDPDDLVAAVNKRRESLILTDFPTSSERPSLPVTPAPRRRQSFWGEERDEAGELPPAEGVPDQADWDPSAQLEELRRNSLIGPGDLKLPEKRLSKRQMPSTAVRITEGALNHPHVPIVNSDEVGSAGIAPHAPFSGGSSPHGLDGTNEHSEQFFSSVSRETAVNTAVNSSATTVTAADKPVFSEPGFLGPSAPTVSGSAVAADEVDMKSEERDFPPEATDTS
ncbi:hypothetical protein PRZ48_002085 [Zasmidium cellare]|uniref:Glycogenin n=1 Tax=Zasmidium cellare TaxID=395010 RepID=A0ABR0F315_ZASCE|nr:hypothetical protein PRZ48_002085 [Zasmidium cellare]